MKVFKSNDGEVYLTREEIPVIGKSDNSEEINELEVQIALNEAKCQELEQKLNTQYNYLNKLREERKNLNNGHNQPTYKPTTEIEMSTLKILSKLGYKHIVMPDVFLRERNYYLDKDIIKNYMSKSNPIIGEVHDKVIVYKRKPTHTSGFYKNGVWNTGREFKWIAEIRVKTAYYRDGWRMNYYQIYLDENKVRLGEPGSPMKYDDIKSALSGLFYIDRTLDYDATKQLILTEMTKQLLKGK